MGQSIHEWTKWNFWRQHLKNLKWPYFVQHNSGLSEIVRIMDTNPTEVFCKKGVLRNCKKGVLRNFTKFPGKQLCRSLFFNKVAGLRPATLLKKKPWHRCFPVNSVKFLRITFSQNTSWRLLLPSKHVLNQESLTLTLNKFQLTIYINTLPSDWRTTFIYLNLMIVELTSIDFTQ